MKESEENGELFKEGRQGSRIVYWPSPQDYNEAVQTPALCFLDSDLAAAEAELDKLGLPRPSTGMFASVYRMQKDGKDWALRCFLHYFPDQSLRYAEIGKALKTCNFDFTVAFDYQERGILIQGNSYPVLKMQWCSGQNLDNWLRENLNKPERLAEFLSEWTRLIGQLQNAGIAHGDLQHGNILISDGKITIVDYDCFYVPALEGKGSNELGHNDYQHPGRLQSSFNSQMDNFSAWLIYLSVFILMKDPDLWHELLCGEDRLIFSRRDFLDPQKSPIFFILENHQDQEIREAAKTIRYLCSLPYAELPPLSDQSPGTDELAELVWTQSMQRAYERLHLRQDGDATVSIFEQEKQSELEESDEADQTSDYDQGPLQRARKRPRSRFKGGYSGWTGPAPEPENQQQAKTAKPSPLLQLARKVQGQGQESNIGAKAEIKEAEKPVSELEPSLELQIKTEIETRPESGTDIQETNVELPQENAPEKTLTRKLTSLGLNLRASLLAALLAVLIIFVLLFGFLLICANQL